MGAIENEFGFRVDVGYYTANRLDEMTTKMLGHLASFADDRLAETEEKLFVIKADRESIRAKVPPEQQWRERAALDRAVEYWEAVADEARERSASDKHAAIERVRDGGGHVNVQSIRLWHQQKSGSLFAVTNDEEVEFSFMGYWAETGEILVEHGRREDIVALLRDAFGGKQVPHV